MKVRSYEEIDKILKKASKDTLETLDMCFEMWLDNKISKINFIAGLFKILNCFYMIIVFFIKAHSRFIRYF